MQRLTPVLEGPGDMPSLTGSTARRLFPFEPHGKEKAMRKGTIAATTAIFALLLAAAGTALAGKPSSSFDLVVLSADGARAAAAAEPSYGGQITFDVATNQTDRPHVNVRCYQGEAWVYDGWRGFYPSYYREPIYTLASGYWTGGAADCTARLLYFDRQGRERTLASMDFHVTA
jgi:hypothetical protein